MKSINSLATSILIFLGVFSCQNILADTYNIWAGSYYYAPATLTINLGDTVNWYNEGGFHNVNAETSTITGEDFYNPEAFSSSATSQTGALIYSHVFTIPGTYNYDCSIGSHALNGMVGSINVVMNNNIDIPANPVYVTFRVNMQNEAVNQSGVFMAGGPWQVTGNSALGYTAAGISGGTPPGIAMQDDDNDNIWEATIPLEENTFFYWKFRNGYFTDWAAIEGAWEPNFAGLGCGYWDNGDRRILVSGDQTTYSYCFASCDEVCPQPPVYATLSVNVADFPDPIETVEVQGSFIGWGLGETITLENTAGTIWSTQVLLPANSDHNYRFIVNGQIESLSSVGSCLSVDPSGEFEPTRLLTTTTDDIEVPVVCFESCLDCGQGFEGCTDPNAANYDSNATIDIGGCVYDMLFSVDMTGYNTASIQTINVNGTFNGWCGSCNELFDDDGDNVYTAVIPLPPGPIEYLYTIDGWSEQEIFGENDQCVVGVPSENDSTFVYYNRVDTVEEVLFNAVPVNCFNSCFECEN
ncbi:MAG: plastocyanin/azurin family copper-binding protein, partial [Bacteroidetes bacterium]|nr:plastocyanin/azurin family copper-binding protein [Bacteroidota bacterium]